jgi:transposase
MEREPYPSDLNDKEWEILQSRLPVKKDPRGRPRKQDLRELLNGIFYLLRTGCSWRMCRTISRHRRRFTASFEHGNAKARGRRFIAPCENLCGSGWDENHTLRPSSSIANRSKRPKKGASRVRRGEESQRQEEAYPYGHTRTPPQGEGSSRRYSRPGWCPYFAERREGSVPASFAAVRGWRIPRGACSLDQGDGRVADGDRPETKLEKRRLVATGR